MKTPGINAPMLLVLLLTAIAWLQAQQSMEMPSGTPTEIFQYARGSFDRRWYDKALETLDYFLAKYPEDKLAEDALCMKINCLLKLNKDDDALAQMQVFLEKHPKSKYADELGCQAGSILLGKKQYAEAEKFFSSVLKNNGSKHRELAMYYKAQCMLAMGKQDGTLLLKKLADLPLDRNFPYRHYATNEIAQSLCNAGDLDKALLLYQKLANFMDAPADIKELALFKCGEILYRQSKYPQALEALNKCLAKFHNGAYGKYVRKYRIFIISANKEHEHVIEYANEWRKLYPKSIDWDLDYIQASALFALKRFDEAIPYFQRVEMDAGAPENNRQQACVFSINALLLAKHNAAAEQKAMAFLEAFPKATCIGEILKMLAQAQQSQGKLDAAADTYKKALIAFEDEPAEFMPIQECLFSILIELKHHTEAAKLLRDSARKPAAKLNGVSPNKLLYRAGLCEYENKNLDAAKKDLLELEDKQEDRDIAYKSCMMLAQICAEQGDYAQALVHMKKASDCCPSDARADLEYKMVSLTLKQNDFAAAEALLEKALENKALTPDQRLRCQVLLAKVLMHSQPQKAVPQLDAMLQMTDAELEAHIDLPFLKNAAKIYQDGRQPGKAQAIYRRMLRWPKADKANLLNAELLLAKSLMASYPESQEIPQLLDKVLNTLQNDSTLPPGFSIAEIHSLLAEAYLKCKNYDHAEIEAQNALNDENGDAETRARAMYVLAFILLKVREKPEEANNCATFCFICSDHPIYSPETMGISVECFRKLGKITEAENVLKELEQKYPDWLALHPELKR